MDLSKFSSEYTDSFEFSKAAHQEAFDLSDENYFTLSGSTKQLIEEILPIALLAQHLRTPELQVDVLWFNDSESRDGKIRLRGKPVELGFYKAEYFVEVTTAVSPNDFVFGGDNISRQGKRGSSIVSDPEVQETGAYVSRLAEWIIDCAKAKSKKKYPTPCILVINAKSEKKMSILDWAHVFELMQAEAIESKFESIYAIDVYNNSVISLPNQSCISGKK
jgi:hypothetical protein